MTAKERLPINDPAYWRQRLVRNRMIHQDTYHTAVNDCPTEEWRAIQETHRTILAGVLRPGISLLDAGCGYGALIEILPEKVGYAGVDSSPDLIAVAQTEHPERNFVIADLSKLPFSDRQFDVCVCRSIQGMVIDHLGIETWNDMEDELLRVSKRLILLSYSEPAVVHVLVPDRHPDHNVVCSVELDGGHLNYCVSPGNVCEVYNVYVPREKRRQKIGMRMHQSLFGLGFATVYGFSRADNAGIIGLQRKLGFRHLPIPGFYPNRVDAVFAFRNDTTTKER